MGYQLIEDSPTSSGYTLLPDAPQTPQAPLTRLDKVMQGVIDPINGGAQLLTKALPQSVVDAGNSFNNWLADKTGIVAKIPERSLSGLVLGKTGGVDQMVRDNEAQYQARRVAQGETGLDGYRLIGNVVSPANLAVAGVAPVKAASLLARTAVSAGAGAATGALAPVTDGSDYWSDKLKQVGLSAAGGAAVPLVTGAAARVLSPNASTNADLALLKAEGVSPTIGQTLGGRWNALEEKAQSIPIVGDMISLARNRGREQFNSAAINRATAPIGVEIKTTGQAGVADAGDAISAAYNNAKSKLGNFSVDKQATGEFFNWGQTVNSLPPKEQGSLKSLWAYVTNELSPSGTISADGFKRIDSKIGSEAASFSGSQDAYQQKAGEALKQLQKIITDNAKRANPTAAQLLDKADEAYANLVRVEGASKAAMNSGGVFTPGQLNMAARQADQSVRDRATARGTALMQDLGNAGQNVLGNKVPNSFTADRGLLAGGAGLLAGGGGAISPAIPAAIVGGAAMYTKPAQWLLNGAVSARPSFAQPVAESMRRFSPMLAPAGGLLGIEFSQ